jgi:Tfp pilus assembly protein PilO
VTPAWKPWQRLLPVWLPAVVVCFLSAGILIWQTSESGGRAALVGNSVEDLEAELVRLEQIRGEAVEERAAVADLNERFGYLYGSVFGNLDERLTGILRAVGLAARGAGLLPGRYGYSAEEDRKLGYVRFTIQFAVEGQYSQIREMLAALQSSSEFLVVEDIGFSGEEEAASRTLKISVKVTTFVTEADPKTLERLTGGIKMAVEETDGQTEG